MFKRMAASWELVKASANVLKADKELIVFPIVSAVGSILVLITFAFPMFLAGMFGDQILGEEGLTILGYLLVFLFYLVQYFVIFFANTALVGAALIRLDGGDPTVQDGFGIAMKHIGSIFGYALISATVGMVLRIISERGGVLGRIVSSLFGLAWNVATFLVVPVLVAEEVGPIEAVKRSTAHLKRTWGEQIIGNFGIGAIFALIFAGIVLVGLGGFFMAALAESVVLMGVMIALTVLAVILLSLVNSALSGIYTAAVYNYAVKGEIGGYFDDELVKNAFRQK